MFVNKVEYQNVVDLAESEAESSIRLSHIDIWRRRSGVFNEGIGQEHAYVPKAQQGSRQVMMEGGY